jgi:hypothetical protein
MFLVQQLRTTADTNGNSRSLYVVYNPALTEAFDAPRSTEPSAVYQSGAEGTPADVREGYYAHTHSELPVLDVPPSQYNELLTWAHRRGVLR